jgi:hypothetical protein
VAADTQSNLLTRMTVVGIIGQRKMTDQASTLRQLVDSTEPSLKRVVLANLGMLGDPSDLPLVQRFVTDDDVSIANAAKGAEKRLLAANTQQPAPQLNQ